LNRKSRVFYGSLIIVVAAVAGLILALTTTPLNDVVFHNYNPWQLSSWIQTTNYPKPIDWGSCVVYSGYIYCVGGWNIGTSSRAVYYAHLLATGGIDSGGWQLSPILYPEVNGVMNHSCVMDSGYIYCVGNSVPYTNGRAVYYAHLLLTGGIDTGGWHQTADYPLFGGGASCVVYSGHIFCIGFDNCCSIQLAFAPLKSSGGIDTVGWYSWGLYSLSSFSGQSCGLYLDYMYCVGGGDGSTLSNRDFFYVHLSPNGGYIGGMITQTAFYPIPINSQSCFVYSYSEGIKPGITRGVMYCVGGRSSSGATSDVYFARLVNTGGITGAGFTKITRLTYPTPIWGHSCVMDARNIYCVGGIYGTDNAVYYQRACSSDIYWSGQTSVCEP